MPLIAIYTTAAGQQGWVGQVVQLLLAIVIENTTDIVMLNVFQGFRFNNGYHYISIFDRYIDVTYLGFWVRVIFRVTLSTLNIMIFFQECAWKY